MVFFQLPEHFFGCFSYFLTPCIIYHWKAKVLRININVLNYISGAPIKGTDFLEHLAGNLCAISQTLS